jgi:anti-sigma factor RsiW
VNCDEVAALLAAEVDGELDRLRAHALHRHLACCAGCTARRETLLALRTLLRAELPYHDAPPALAARLRADATGALARGSSASMIAMRWRWFGSGVLTGSLAAGLGWAAWIALATWLPVRDLPTRLIALHSHAMLATRLVDVESSDRHTLKPWLSARLDYAPPVVDASAAGFALLGARVDRLDGRAVAVLVYRHRDHVIDVVVRVADLACDRAAPPQTVRGFNVAAACGAQMQWLATSDLNMAELAAFVQSLARDAGTPG